MRKKNLMNILAVFLRSRLGVTEITRQIYINTTFERVAKIDFKYNREIALNYLNFEKYIPVTCNKAVKKIKFSKTHLKPATTSEIYVLSPRKALILKIKESKFLEVFKLE